MATYNFKSTGGTHTFTYDFGKCSSEAKKILSLESDSDWLTVEDTLGIVYVTAGKTTENKSREGRIKVSVNGVPCDKNTLSFTQEAMKADCECFSIVYIDNIPSDGLPKGTVIGEYTIDETCDTNAIDYRCEYPEVELKNGQIILAEDVEPNLSTKEDKTFVLYVFFGDDTSTPCIEQNFYQSIAGCNCKNIFSFVAPVHIFFSNLGEEEHPNAGYTQLKDVLVASAKTECGEFKAITADKVMLSSSIKGQTVEDRVLMEEKDGVTYAYITVNPQGENDIPRSAELNIYFKEKNAEKYLDCRESILIIQSKDDYWRCGTETLNLDSMSYHYSTSCGIASCLSNKEISCLGDTTNTVLPLYSELLATKSKEVLNVIIKMSFDSMFYVKDIESVLCKALLCPQYIAYRIPSDATRTPYSVQDYESEYDLSISSRNEINFKFTKINDGSKGFKVVSLSFDLYTEYNEKYNLSGQYCQSLGKINVIQPYENCSSCALKKNSDVFIENSEATKHTRYEKLGIVPESIFLCGGNIIDIRLEEPSYGEIKLYKDSNDYVQTYDLILYENNTDSNRIIRIYQKVRFNDGKECEALYEKYEKIYNRCTSCEETLKNIKYASNVENASAVNSNDCTSDKSVTINFNGGNNSWYTTSLFNLTFQHLNSTAEFDYCYDAYIVFCKKDGTGEFLSDGEFTTDCGAKLKYDGYVEGKGQRVSSTYQYMSVFVEDVSKEKITNHFFKLKLYNKGTDTLVCESETKFFRGKILWKTCYEMESLNDKTYYLDKNYYSKISINSGFETEVSNGSTYVKLPIKDETYTIYTLPVENNSDMTKSSISYPLCEGYIINYVIKSTSEDNIVATISGKDIIIKVQNSSSLTPNEKLTIDLTGIILKKDTGEVHDDKTINVILYLLFE